MESFSILALDQGTTGTRAILYDSSFRVLSSAYQEFHQYYPQPGWVEHDPQEIWKSACAVIRKAVRACPLPASRIAAVGITNQRETIVIWERKTGRPVHRAIVWQDRRTSDFCAELRKNGLEDEIRSKTGLVIDPYFSATKIHWLLRHQPGLRNRARRGELLFGTIDSWLAWKMTGGRTHATDYTNASRTLLFNIQTRTWDDELLRLFGVHETMLPGVRESGANFGATRNIPGLPDGIPIRSMIGDQQAALYGQGCHKPGQAKNTYGTGCFLVLNLGPRYRRPPHGLLATLACDEAGKPVYAFEGAVFIAGAAIQWLRDGLGFFKDAAETEKLVRGLKDSGGVVMVPAFAGLGSPYWKAEARGMISGITRGTTRAHIIRAALEAIAHQSADVIEAMSAKSGFRLRELRVDGGATANRFLMQFQADLLGMPVAVSIQKESTAWGAAKLAARAAGLVSAREVSVPRSRERFFPRWPRKEAVKKRLDWKREIGRLLI